MNLDPVGLELARNIFIRRNVWIDAYLVDLLDKHNKTPCNPETTKQIHNFLLTELRASISANSAYPTERRYIFIQAILCQLVNGTSQKVPEKLAYTFIEKILMVDPNVALGLNETNINLFMYAALYQLPSIVELLIRYGANIEQKSNGSENLFQEHDTAALLELRRNPATPSSAVPLLAQLYTHQMVSSGEWKQALTTPLRWVAWEYRASYLGTTDNQLRFRRHIDAVALLPYYQALREYYNVREVFLESKLRVNDMIKNIQATGFKFDDQTYTFTNPQGSAKKADLSLYMKISMLDAAVTTRVLSFIYPKKKAVYLHCANNENEMSIVTGLVTRGELVVVEAESEIYSYNGIFHIRNVIDDRNHRTNERNSTSYPQGGLRNIDGFTPDYGPY